MKKSQKTDARCIELMLKYISHMEEAYNHYNISSKNDLEENVLCHLAITQLIINVHECKKKVTAESLSHLPHFLTLGRSLKMARNIAGHEYDEINFELLHRLIIRLTDDKTIRELEGLYEALRCSN